MCRTGNLIWNDRNNKNAGGAVDEDLSMICVFRTSVRARAG